MADVGDGRALSVRGMAMALVMAATRPQVADRSILTDPERPSLFEVHAADQLSQQLGEASQWALSVAAQRNPTPLAIRLAQRGDEVVALASLLLEWYHLRTANASLGEAMYGLRRVGAPPRGSLVGHRSRAPLTPAQRRASLAVLVAIPYLRVKVSRWRLARADPFGVAARRRAAAARDSGPMWRDRLADLAQGALAAGDWLGLALAVGHTAGVLDAWSPWLYLCGQRVRRAVPADAALSGRAKARARALALAGASPAWARVLRLAHGAADNARYLLLGAVIAFKFSEWFYRFDAQMGGRPALPVPPPPTAPPRARGGTKLPSDPGTCPLCVRKRTNAAVLDRTGFAFCYPCILTHVRKHGRCPVSHVRVSEANVRKLYDDAT